MLGKINNLGEVFELNHPLLQVPFIGLLSGLAKWEWFW
jgi:hypothetical protein